MPTPVQITDFAPEPYEVVGDIRAIVHVDPDDCFVASISQANINASGETLKAAVASLKDIMVQLFEMLAAAEPKKLGKGPTQQLAFLRSVMRKRL